MTEQVFLMSFHWVLRAMKSEQNDKVTNLPYILNQQDKCVYYENIK